MWRIALISLLLLSLCSAVASAQQLSRIKGSVAAIPNRPKSVIVTSPGAVLGPSIIANLPACTSASAGTIGSVLDNDAACSLNAAPAHSTCTVGTTCNTCGVICGEAGSTTYAWHIL